MSSSNRGSSAGAGGWHEPQAGLSPRLVGSQSQSPNPSPSPNMLHSRSNTPGYPHSPSYSPSPSGSLSSYSPSLSASPTPSPSTARPRERSRSGSGSPSTQHSSSPSLQGPPSASASSGRVRFVEQNAPSQNRRRGSTVDVDVEGDGNVAGGSSSLKGWLSWRPSKKEKEREKKEKKEKKMKEEENEENQRSSSSSPFSSSPFEVAAITRGSPRQPTSPTPILQRPSPASSPTPSASASPSPIGPPRSTGPSALSPRLSVFPASEATMETSEIHDRTRSRSPSSLRFGEAPGEPGRGETGPREGLSGQQHHYQYQYQNQNQNQHQQQIHSQHQHQDSYQYQQQFQNQSIIIKPPPQSLSQQARPGSTRAQQLEIIIPPFFSGSTRASASFSPSASASASASASPTRSPHSISRRSSSRVSPSQSPRSIPASPSSRNQSRSRRESPPHSYVYAASSMSSPTTTSLSPARARARARGGFPSLELEPVREITINGHRISSPVSAGFGGSYPYQLPPPPPPPPRSPRSPSHSHSHSHPRSHLPSKSTSPPKSTSTSAASSTSTFLPQVGPMAFETGGSSSSIPGSLSWDENLAWFHRSSSVLDTVATAQQQQERHATVMSGADISLIPPTMVDAEEGLGLGQGQEGAGIHVEAYEDDEEEDQDDGDYTSYSARSSKRWSSRRLSQSQRFVPVTELVNNQRRFSGTSVASISQYNQHHNRRSFSVDTDTDSFLPAFNIIPATPQTIVDGTGVRSPSPMEIAGIDGVDRADGHKAAGENEVIEKEYKAAPRILAQVFNHEPMDFSTSTSASTSETQDRLHQVLPIVQPLSLSSKRSLSLNSFTTSTTPTTATTRTKSPFEPHHHQSTNSFSSMTSTLSSSYSCSSTDTSDSLMSMSSSSSLAIYAEIDHALDSLLTNLSPSGSFASLSISTTATPTAPSKSNVKTGDTNRNRKSVDQLSIGLQGLGFGITQDATTENHLSQWSSTPRASSADGPPYEATAGAVFGSPFALTTPRLQSHQDSSPSPSPSTPQPNNLSRFQNHNQVVDRNIQTRATPESPTGSVTESCFDDDDDDDSLMSDMDDLDSASIKIVASKTALSSPVRSDFGIDVERFAESVEEEIGIAL